MSTSQTNTPALNNLFCSICNKQCANKLGYNSHINSSAHYWAKKALDEKTALEQARALQEALEAQQALEAAERDEAIKSVIEAILQQVEQTLEDQLDALEAAEEVESVRYAVDSILEESAAVELEALEADGFSQYAKDSILEESPAEQAQQIEQVVQVVVQEEVKVSNIPVP